MGQLLTDPIKNSDIEEYVKTQSSFAFELEILELLNSLGCVCEHGGTYADSITGKPRQFDIRARLVNQHFKVSLAVECKSIGEHFPLVVERVPRRNEEAFHDIVFSVGTALRVGETIGSFTVGAGKHAFQLRSCAGSIYRAGEPVGKTCVQVGRSKQSIEVNDSDVYEKWAQAVSSSVDLVEEGMERGRTSESEFFFTAVIPILVVPDGRMWAVDYKSNGSKRSAPQSIDRCSYFLGRSLNLRSNVQPMLFNISHLEFVTKSGLVALIEDLKNLEMAFPNRFLSQQMQQLVENGAILSP